MIDSTHAQMIALYFGPSAMTAGAIVFAVSLALLAYITIRDHITNFDKENRHDTPRTVDFPGN
jgi:hypothetical protein